MPLDEISALFAGLAANAIVEFVPKDDPMVVRMLASREDVFPGYTLEGFRVAFGREFAITRESPIEGSRRTLLELRRR